MTTSTERTITDVVTRADLNLNQVIPCEAEAAEIIASLEAERYDGTISTSPSQESLGQPVNQPHNSRHGVIERVFRDIEAGKATAGAHPPASPLARASYSSENKGGAGSSACFNTGGAGPSVPMKNVPAPTARKAKIHVVVGSDDD